MVDCFSFQTGKRFVPKDRLIFRPSAYALIVHEGKLLLVTNRLTHLYALPGGKIELGERMEETLRREVREETGIDIQVKEFCRFEEGFFYFDPLDEAYHSLLFFFRCTPRSLEFSDKWSIDDVEGNPEWVDIADLKTDSIVHGKLILEVLSMDKQTRSSGEVGTLVEEVLASLPRPWSKHIIRQVGDAIMNNLRWKSRYDQLVNDHGRAAVNRQIGHSTLQLTGLRNLGTREEAKNSIIDTYTLLG